MTARCLPVPALLMLAVLAGCDAQPQGRTVNGVVVPAGAIAPGIYSNVRMSGETGDLGGLELRLDRGSDSAFVEITRCEGWCNSVERVAIRRGMGGISFAFPTPEGEQSSRMIAVQPDGADVQLSVDWGQGLQTYVLHPIPQEFGLDVARHPQGGR